MSHGGGGVFGLNELFVSGATIPTQFVEVGLNLNSCRFYVLLLFLSDVSTSQFVRDTHLPLSFGKRKETVPIFLSNNNNNNNNNNKLLVTLMHMSQEG
jgi:hypothetical protein